MLSSCLSFILICPHINVTVVVYIKYSHPIVQIITNSKTNIFYAHSSFFQVLLLLNPYISNDFCKVLLLLWYILIWISVTLAGCSWKMSCLLKVLNTCVLKEKLVLRSILKDIKLNISKIFTRCIRIMALKFFRKFL